MSYLTGCRLLRCRSLRIQRPANLKADIEQRLAETEKLVTGPTRAVDTYLQWLELEEVITVGMPEIKGSKFCDDERVSYFIENVREAAERYAAVKFEEHKHEIMDLARQWTEESSSGGWQRRGS